MNSINKNIQGVAYISLAMLIFSLQSVAVKWIGGDYSVMEIVLFRSFIALPCTIVLYRLEGGKGWPSTEQRTLEYVRGVLFFFHIPLPSWRWRPCRWLNSRRFVLRLRW